MFSPTEIQLKHLHPVTHLAMGDSYHLQVDDRDGKNLVFCVTAKWSKVLPVCKTQKKKTRKVELLKSNGIERRKCFINLI